MSDHQSDSDENQWPMYVLLGSILGGLIVFGVMLMVSCPGLMSQEPPEGTVKIHQLLYESTSILGVSVAIVVAGLAVAAPLYIFLWQSLTDSIFHVFLTLSDQYERASVADKEKLKKLKQEAFDALQDLQNRIKPMRLMFGFSLIWAICLLVLLATVIVLPRQEYAYVVATGAVLLSLGLATSFLSLVLRVQRLGPVPQKFTLQIALAKILDERDHEQNRNNNYDED